MNEGGPAPRVIDGRFELGARLGGGGMGTVWRARDLVLGRAVALKEVRPPDPELTEHDPSAAAQLRARVLREAQALARVDHPNVVTIHHIVDSGEGTYPWLVMELVTGGSLADRLARGPMEPHEAAVLGREILAALRAAHDAGIQHRDVKPANVLLRPDGRPVLTDFGIAAIREATQLTATGSVIGTPDYMPPERASGDTGGPESDLWSLAMMLYVAVEGHHPLRRATTLATLAAVLSEPVPPPHRAGPLGPVLMSVLVRDPAARPDPARVDAMLARAAQAPAADPAATADRPDSPTSYPLRPPAAAHSPTAPGTSPRDATPRDARAAGTTNAGAPSGGTTSGHVASATTVSSAAGRAPRGGGGFGPAVRAALAGTAVVGTVLVSAAVWALWPEDKAADASAGGPSHSTSAPASPVSPSPGVSAKQRDLLTPDGIRVAVKALKKATGTDRVCDFTVYPDHVSASVMVDGSRTKYDNWTYFSDRGAEKGIISGTVTSMQSPFDIDSLDWDVVPDLLAKARRTLKVTDPTSRYLVVKAPDPTFHTALGMMMYLSNDYHESGYVETDAKGTVRRTMPFDGG
jgi:serine/threonine protein kinase